MHWDRISRFFIITAILGVFVSEKGMFSPSVETVKAVRIEIKMATIKGLMVVLPEKIVRAGPIAAGLIISGRLTNLEVVGGLLFLHRIAMGRHPRRSATAKGPSVWGSADYAAT